MPGHGTETSGENHTDKSGFKNGLSGGDPVEPDTRRVEKGCIPGASDSPAGNAGERYCAEFGRDVALNRSGYQLG
jgi:hypothetical protein